MQLSRFKDTPKQVRRETDRSGLFMTKRLRYDLTQRGRSGNGASLHGGQWSRDREGKGKKKIEVRYRVQVQTQQLAYYMTLDKSFPLWGCGRLSCKMHYNTECLLSFWYFHLMP